MIYLFAGHGSVVARLSLSALKFPNAFLALDTTKHRDFLSVGPAFLDGSRIPAIWLSVLLAPLGGQDTGPSFFFNTRGRSQGDYLSRSVTFDLQASWKANDP